MTSKLAKIYQSFLSLSRAVEEGLDFPLSPEEKSILMQLSHYWANEEPVTVVAAMNGISGMSTSSVFRYLKKLRLNGYIELKIDEKDNRVKYILPTKKTDKYFSGLGKIISQLSST